LDRKRWRRACPLFAAVLRCASADRVILLAAARADDPDLRADVERLLADDAGTTQARGITYIPKGGR
jgi:hypothetical protein